CAARTAWMRWLEGDEVFWLAGRIRTAVGPPLPDRQEAPATRSISRRRGGRRWRCWQRGSHPSSRNDALQAGERDRLGRSSRRPAEYELSRLMSFILNSKFQSPKSEICKRLVTLGATKFR